MTEPGTTLRLDKWLWHARFFRTRSLAARAVAEGVRVNGARTVKPGAAVRAGDVLTFAQAGRIRVIEVAALGARRGPAAEARRLYLDHAPPGEAVADAAARRDADAPHPAADAPAPDRRARRALRGLRRSDT